MYAWFVVLPGGVCFRSGPQPPPSVFRTGSTLVWPGMYCTVHSMYLWIILVNARWCYPRVNCQPKRPSSALDPSDQGARPSWAGRREFRTDEGIHRPQCSQCPTLWPAIVWISGLAMGIGIILSISALRKAVAGKHRIDPPAYILPRYGYFWWINNDITSYSAILKEVECLLRFEKRLGVKDGDPPLLYVTNHAGQAVTRVPELNMQICNHMYYLQRYRIFDPIIISLCQSIPVSPSLVG